MTFYTTFTTKGGTKAAYIYNSKKQLIAADRSNVCQNYTGNKGFALGESVNRMYELEIGGWSSILCPDCLERIRNLIESI